MKNISYSIEKLGFNKCFQDNVDPESLQRENPMTCKGDAGYTA
jgi:hypothetical protein